MPSVVCAGTLKLIPWSNRARRRRGISERDLAELDRAGLHGRRGRVGLVARHGLLLEELQDAVHAAKPLKSVLMLLKSD